MNARAALEKTFGDIAARHAYVIVQFKITNRDRKAANRSSRCSRRIRPATRPDPVAPINIFSAGKTGVGCRPYLLELLHHGRSSWQRIGDGNK
jgi:hypothetical protein